MPLTPLVHISLREPTNHSHVVFSLITLTVSRLGDVSKWNLQIYFTL